MKKKIIIFSIILITLTNALMPVVNAAQIITKANLINDHKIKTHIEQENKNGWFEVLCNYICYKEESNKYPAYCIMPGTHGVDEEGSYTVTVNKLLNDKLIYNTLINGYPYKTPNQLGVETADDAYVATKLALKSALLDRDVREQYKALDEKGEKIINAMESIANKGKSGNATNKEATISINKIGEFKESGDYYYQEYSVSANVNISDFSINSIEKFPEGSYIIDINGNKKDSFYSGENFKVMIPKSKLNKDIEGRINIIASCNTNPIFYGEAPNASIQDYAVTYKTYVDYGASTVLSQNTNTASIKIIKQDTETLKPIKDVTFGLYNKNDEYITSKTTNFEGIALFDNLYQGIYNIKEIKANENYVHDDTVYEINTEYNKEVVRTINNTHKKGSLKITKVDKDDNLTFLEGIEFDLIDSNNKVIAHLVTDTNGEAFVSNINIGKYTLKETKTKENYNLCIDNNIEVRWNEISEIKIENEKKKGQIKIIKQDAENSNIKLEGVDFQIIDINNNVLDEVVTNSNGIAISSRVPIGEYYLKEIKTNNRYKLNQEIIKINIKYDEVLRLDIENEKIKGRIKIVKTSSNDSPILNIKQGDALQGVEFEIFNSNNQLVDTLVTDEFGQATSKDLEIGRYKVVERSTNKYYILNRSEFFVNIENDNEIKVLEIENEAVVPRLDIEKTGQQFAEKNEEVKYEFDIKNISNTKLDNFTWIEYIPYEDCKATKLVTGLYNENIDYEIYYKTDKSEYRLLRKANSLTSEYINLDDLNLEDKEIITEIKVEYGTVAKDFKAIVKPSIFVKINNDVKKDDKIINMTELSGNIEDYIVKDKSGLKTVIIEKEILKKLPKTGC